MWSVIASSWELNVGSLSSVASRSCRLRKCVFQVIWLNNDSIRDGDWSAIIQSTSSLSTGRAGGKSRATQDYCNHWVSAEGWLVWCCCLSWMAIPAGIHAIEYLLQETRSAPESERNVESDRYHMEVTWDIERKVMPADKGGREVIGMKCCWQKNSIKVATLRHFLERDSAKHVYIWIKFYVYDHAQDARRWWYSPHDLTTYDILEYYGKLSFVNRL